MRVLNLSLDSKVLETGSPVQKRLILLAEKAGSITVLVPSERNRREQISERLAVQSVGGVKLFQFLKLWSKGSRELQTKKFDLITVQDAYFLGLLGYALSRRFRVPLEIQVHGLEGFSGIRKRIAKFVLRRADRIRVVSNRLKAHLAISYKLKANSLYVLPVYTQIEPSQGTAKRKTVPYPFTFLTVGRLVPVKNINLQIRAFAKVAGLIPHIRLRIVGDGPERANLQQITNNLQLGDKVIFEGEQKDLGRYYEEADAFLFTSDAEGWGRVVLEAAAYHLPIIMTDVGLAREVIKNEESGFIIPVRDEHELVLAMKEFLDKPEFRLRLGEEALRVFKALPSQEMQIEKQVEEWQAPINRK